MDLLTLLSIALDADLPEIIPATLYFSVPEGLIPIGKMNADLTKYFSCRAQCEMMYRHFTIGFLY
jgi:hypothetical protein